MALRFVILSLAAYRITRLIVNDSEDDEDVKGFPPAVAVRTAIVRRFGVESSWVDLISCPWCSGFWVSAGVVLIGWRTGAIVDRLLLVWAVSAVVGGLSSLFKV